MREHCGCWCIGRDELMEGVGWEPMDEPACGAATGRGRIRRSFWQRHGKRVELERVEATAGCRRRTPGARGDRLVWIDQWTVSQPA